MVEVVGEREEGEAASRVVINKYLYLSNAYKIHIISRFS